MDLSTLTPLLKTTNHISSLPNIPPEIRTCITLVEQLYKDLKTLTTLFTPSQEYSNASSSNHVKRINDVIVETTEVLVDVGVELDGCAIRTHGLGLKKLSFRKEGWAFCNAGKFGDVNRGLEKRLEVMKGEISRLRGTEVRMEEQRGFVKNEIERTGVWDTVGVQQEVQNENRVEGKATDDDDFENLDLLRLTPRMSTVPRNIVRRSITLRLEEETGLGETDHRALARRSVGFYHQAEPTSSMTAKSQLSLKLGNDTETFNDPDPALLLPIPVASEEQEILPQNQQLINDFHPLHIDSPSFSQYPHFVHQIHHQASTTSLTSTAASTRSRANTFTLQALREQEPEDDFSGSSTSPSSASFMSSRLSTISSRTSIRSAGSLRSSNGSLSRSTRIQRKPQKMLTYGEETANEWEDEEVLNTFQAPSSQFQNPTYMPSLQSSTEDSGEDLMIWPSFRIPASSASLFPPDHETSLHQDTLRPSELVQQRIHEDVHTQIQKYEEPEDDDSDDSFFREMKRQEVENKKRLTARQT